MADFSGIHNFIMSNFYLTISDINFFQTLFRLFLALLCGGVIGLERGFTKHSAGFRTHILVSIGATLVMMTNLYIVNNLGFMTDPARLGAQVITGIGFLGVGIIFVTGKHKIKGLTTAAGLWTSATVGLAIGVGFYSGAIICTLLMFLALHYLPILEVAIYNNSPIVNIYVELDHINSLKPFLKHIKSTTVKILDVHISSTGPITTDGVAFHLQLKIQGKLKYSDIEEYIDNFEGIIFAERL